MDAYTSNRLKKEDMKRVREKIKAIWHIITDDEYVVFTVSIKDGARRRSCALISDNSSRIFIDTIIEFLPRFKKKHNL